MLAGCCAHALSHPACLLAGCCARALSDAARLLADLHARILGCLVYLPANLHVLVVAAASREVLKFCLTRPKACVGAVLACKLLVGPRLHDAAGLEDVHLVAAAQGCQAVRHHDDGLGVRELGHGVDDRSLAVCVDVGGCLVEDVDGRVVQQGACHGETLALAAGEVRALGADGSVQAAAATHEIVDAAAAECLPQLVVACPGARHQQVRAHGAGKEEAAEAHVGHRVAQAFGRDVAQVDAADRGAAGIAAVGAREDAGQGRLARPACARDAHEAAGPCREVGVLEHGAGPVIGVRYAAAFDAHRSAGDGPGAAGRFGGVDDAVHALGCGHAACRRVEERAQRAQRDEEVCREEHEGERTGKGHGAGRIGVEHHDDACCGTRKGKDVHDDHGVQLHGEQAHRGLAELLRLLVHPAMTPLIGPEDLERGETLDALQEERAQVGVGVPVVAHDALGDFHDSHEGDRNERHAAQEHHCGRGAQWGQAEEERNRGNEGIEEVRQVVAEIRLKLLDAFDAKLCRLARGDSLAIARPHAYKLVVHERAHALLGQGGCRKALLGCLGLTGEPYCHGHDGHEDRAGQVGPYGGTRKHGLQQATHAHEQDDVGQKGQPLQGDVGGDVAHDAGNEGKQAFVKHSGSSAISRKR